jgi:hypothetical protein
MTTLLRAPSGPCMVTYPRPIPVSFPNGPPTAKSPKRCELRRRLKFLRKECLDEVHMQRFISGALLAGYDSASVERNFDRELLLVSRRSEVVSLHGRLYRHIRFILNERVILLHSLKELPVTLAESAICNVEERTLALLSQVARKHLLRFVLDTEPISNKSGKSLSVLMLLCSFLLIFAPFPCFHYAKRCYTVLKLFSSEVGNGPNLAKSATQLGLLERHDTTSTKC